jgi:hypothetical protein
LAAFSISALACACCAEPGTYVIRTFKPDAYYLDIIGEIQFDRAASLYMTDAGFDGVKGLDTIRKEYESGLWVATPGEFDLASAFTAKTWRFNLKTKGGKSGTLTLPMPATMLNYMVDMHDEENRPNGPLLYKELRFKGVLASGSGFFGSSVAKPTTYFLVFQGRGNGCDNASDYTHWRLEITGRKADYSFFGKLKAAPGTSALVQTYSGLTAPR